MKNFDRVFIVWVIVVSLVIFKPTGATADPGDPLIIEDIFGRRINDTGLVVVDWEGHIANPAIAFFVRPGTDIQLPQVVGLSANGSRLYFDGDTPPPGPSVPSSSVQLMNASSRAPFYLSIFPDRDGLNEDYELTINYRDSSSTLLSLIVPIHVIDQDLNRPLDFNITLNFAQDTTGFFNNAAARQIAQQAADDWADHIADMNLNTVFAGTETTFIWNPEAFVTGHFVMNTQSYKGLLFYVYGVHTPEVRSGGAPSLQGGYQSGGVSPMTLRRSGDIAMETQGNYNTLGWRFSTLDSEWADSGNFGDEICDFYSIIHHEMGHAMAFNPGYPLFSAAKSLGQMNDAQVVAYLGAAAAVDVTDHFSTTIDPLSFKGGFGYEYAVANPPMPRRRWIFTKFDILALQAVGYQLRQTSAFVPLAILDSTLPTATRKSAFAYTVRGAGGLPAYDWTLSSGALPSGLALDRKSGEIAGTPTVAGNFNFVLWLRDNTPGSAGIQLSTSIAVLNPAGVETWNFYN